MTNYPDVDYGPLKQLLGTWKGDQGVDIAPEPDGEENNPYYETIIYEDVGDLANAEEQKLAAVHYRQIVRRKSNDDVFHDQTGYWIWDAESKTVMHSFVIPRAVSVVAGGKYNGEVDAEGRVVLELTAKIGDPEWSIVQSPFMTKKASSMEFSQKVIVGSGKMNYSQTTWVDIYGKKFEHTDDNELSRE
ncbi:MAG: heme-binding beta-barrel domain-containing protein [Alphaproteobacteria bacterium]|nr:heme-binding beta-barrel domain-containing protein [Rhodospirillales bacterium]MCW9045612.1 heme-binding beta-barrel domain-containing protein [Alphaproteobacteria bacterium]